MRSIERSQCKTLTQDLQPFVRRGRDGVHGPTLPFYFVSTVVVGRLLSRIQQPRDRLRSTLGEAWPRASLDRVLYAFSPSVHWTASGATVGCRLTLQYCRWTINDCGQSIGHRRLTYRGLPKTIFSPVQIPPNVSERFQSTKFRGTTKLWETLPLSGPHVSPPVLPIETPPNSRGTTACCRFPLMPLRVCTGRSPGDTAGVACADCTSLAAGPSREAMAAQAHARVRQGGPLWIALRRWSCAVLRCAAHPKGGVISHRRCRQWTCFELLRLGGGMRPGTCGTAHRHAVH